MICSRCSSHLSGRHFISRWALASLEFVSASECWAVVHGLARLGKAEFQNHFLRGLPIAEARGLKRRGLWPKSCRMNTYPKMRMGRIEKRRRKAAASFQPCERGFPVPSTVASLPQSRGALREALSFVPLHSPSLGARMCLFGRSEEHTSELQSRLHLVCRLLL